MERSEFILDGRTCLVWSHDAPDALLVEPIDRRDLDFIGNELDFLEGHSERPFALAAFIVEDWNVELSPWPADPVFGRDAFGDGAGRTLRFIEDSLIPEVLSRRPALAGKDVILGGYSLAALFALWAAYESRSFSAIAAASPSVWFPGWLDFARGRGQFGRGGRPVDRGQRSFVEEQRPFVSGPRAFVSGQGPFGDGRGSFVEEQKPVGRGQRSFVEGRRWLVEEQRPFGRGQRSSVEEQRPFVSGQGPFSDGRKPVDRGQRSLVEEQRPFVSGPRAFVSGQGPFGEGRKSVVEKQKPVVSGREPFVCGWSPEAERIYLSLGDQESRTRNRVMSTVGERITEYADLLTSQGIVTTLEWNPGNHFQDADLRTAKAFLWCLNSVRMPAEH